MAISILSTPSRRAHWKWILIRVKEGEGSTIRLNMEEGRHGMFPRDHRCSLVFNKHDHKCFIPISGVEEPSWAILTSHTRRFGARHRSGRRFEALHTGLTREHDIGFPASCEHGRWDWDMALIDWITRQAFLLKTSTHWHSGFPNQTACCGLHPFWSTEQKKYFPA